MEATRKAPLDRKEETQEIPSDSKENTDPDEKTREAPSNTEKGAQKALPNLEEETWDGLPSDRKEKTRKAPPDLEEETLEAPSDPGKDTQEVPLNPGETQKAPPNFEGETQETPSDPRAETKDVAGLAEGSTDLKGPVVPTRRKLAISGNLPPNNIKGHVESIGERRRERAAPNSFLLTNKEGDEESVSMCDGGVTMIFQMKVGLPEPIARGMPPEQLTGRRR